MVGTKLSILQRIEPLVAGNKNIKILDLGCGQSRNFLPLLQRYPALTYVGIEPNERDASIASGLLQQHKNARILNQYAYTRPAGYEEFDICISLSAIEHIKRLDTFLENSVQCTRRGGKIIHLYDLGHALYPKTAKERLHVFLGNTCPALLPEKKFVRYVKEEEVCEALSRCGADITDITYHQMVSHKSFLKIFQADNHEKAALAEEMVEWEFKISKYLKELSARQRERLFPSICIWAARK